MVKVCAVVGCRSTGTRDEVSFFRIPSKHTGCGKSGRHDWTINPVADERRRRWLKALRFEHLTEEKSKHSTVCSKHFITGKPSSLEETEHPDWVPTINMGYSPRSSTSSLGRFEQHESGFVEAEAGVGLEIPLNLVLHDRNVKTALETQSPASVANEGQDQSQAQRIVTTEVINYREEYFKASEENARLSQKMNKAVISFELFEKDDKMCRYYCGVPFRVLKCIYCCHVEPFLFSSGNVALSKHQKLILTLMKLTHNFEFKDLGYRFQVSATTASRTFDKVIHILFKRLKFLVRWPNREELIENVPHCFKVNFGSKVTVIIDCFELRTERPSDKVASSQHFSKYKQSMTVKFLIGISPQGAITFISEAFCGRSSDKFVTSNSGILDRLLPGDLIIADRGFLISDDVHQYMAEVHAPPFMRGKKQLAPREVEDGRKISNVRIHVERVIGLLRSKFSILDEKCPMTLVRKSIGTQPILNEIVTVCCALINLSPSIIPDA